LKNWILLFLVIWHFKLFNYDELWKVHRIEAKKNLIHFDIKQVCDNQNEPGWLVIWAEEKDEPKNN